VVADDVREARRVTGTGGVRECAREALVGWGEDSEVGLGVGQEANEGLATGRGGDVRDCLGERGEARAVEGLEEVTGVVGEGWSGEEREKGDTAHADGLGGREEGVERRGRERLGRMEDVGGMLKAYNCWVLFDQRTSERLLTSHAR
jgi:hypothetical protein